MKKLTALLTALLLTALLGMSAFAATYTLDDLSMELAPPEEWICLTRYMTADDPMFEESGLPYDVVNAMFTQSSIYLNAIEPNGEQEIVVTMLEYDGSKNIFNISDFNEKFIEETTKSLATDSSFLPAGTTYTSHKVEAVGDVQFLVFAFEKEDGDQTVYGVQYYTIHNGQAINVTLHSYSGAVPDAALALFMETIQTIKFTKTLPNTSPLLPEIGGRTDNPMDEATKNVEKAVAAAAASAAAAAAKDSSNYSIKYILIAVGVFVVILCISIAVNRNKKKNPIPTFAEFAPPAPTQPYQPAQPTEAYQAPSSRAEGDTATPMQDPTDAWDPEK